MKMGAGGKGEGEVMDGDGQKWTGMNGDGRGLKNKQNVRRGWVNGPREGGLDFVMRCVI